MTKSMMDLRELVEKSGDADPLREMIGFAAERLMELEVGGRTGAAHGQKSPERLPQRNGCRDRDWQTLAGNVASRVPKLRTGSCFPSFLEPRRAVEKALTAVIREACVHGVSTRAMDDLVQAMGGTGISKIEVGRLCGEIDGRVEAFLTRPIEGEWRSPLSLGPMARQGSPVDRRHLPEGSPGRAHRLRRRHHRRRREHGWPPRGARHGHRPVRGRDVLDGLSARSRAARPVGRKAGDQRCP